MYEIIFDRVKASRFIKKAKPDLKDCLKQHLLNIKENPYIAEPLIGNFKDLWSYHLKFKRTQYRIIYKIDDKNKLVAVLHISTRENLYKELEHII